MITAHGVTGKLEEARALFNQFSLRSEADGKPLAPKVSLSFIRATTSAGEVGEAKSVLISHLLPLVDEFQDPVAKALAEVMGGLSSQGQVDDAVDLYEQSIVAGHQPTTRTVNALLSTHVSRGDVEGAMGLARAFFPVFSPTPDSPHLPSPLAAKWGEGTTTLQPNAMTVDLLMKLGTNEGAGEIGREEAMFVCERALSAGLVISHRRMVRKLLKTDRTLHAFEVFVRGRHHQVSMEREGGCRSECICGGFLQGGWDGWEGQGS